MAMFKRCLLKRMLVRWLLGVIFHVISNRLPIFTKTSIVESGAQNLSLFKSGASTSASWWSMEGSWGTWVDKKRDLGVPASILMDLRDPMFNVFLTTRTNTGVFRSCLFCVFDV